MSSGVSQSKQEHCQGGVLWVSMWGLPSRQGMSPPTRPPTSVKVYTDFRSGLNQASPSEPDLWRWTGISLAHRSCAAGGSRLRGGGTEGRLQISYL